MCPDLTAIPRALQNERQWVAWRSQRRNGKLTKPPFCPATRSLASVNDPGTWGTFEEARCAYANGCYSGLAFILTAGDPFTGIDLDHAVEASGQMTSWARVIVDHFGSCTEWSPSHTGVHIWVRGALPGTRRRKDHVEMYD